MRTPVELIGEGFGSLRRKFRSRRSMPQIAITQDESASAPQPAPPLLAEPEHSIIMQLPMGGVMHVVRIMTFNIRYAADPPSENEAPWAVRAPLVTSQLRFHSIGIPETFINLQEVLHHQLVDILSGLNDGYPEDKPNWAFIGVGRDDGMQLGEYSPILYRPSVWEVMDWSTIWLSPTPDVPSKGWDAGSIRILTIGHFKHKINGGKIIAMNTHLDNEGALSRLNSAMIINKEIMRLKDSYATGEYSSAIFLTGDLNSTPKQQAYQLLTGRDALIDDVRNETSVERMYGHRHNTFTGFSGGSDSAMLDYIFLLKGGGWTPKTFAILPNRFDDDIYYSDHRPVVTDAELRFS